MKIKRAKFRTYSDYDRKIRAMRQLQAELGVMPMPDIKIRSTVTTPDGNVIHDRYEQGHSWVRNAWNYWTCQILDAAGATASTTVPVGGNAREGFLTLRSYAKSSTFFTGSIYGRGSGFIGSLATQNPGIVIGTSAEPFSVDDYMLWGDIPQGTGTNQMIHGAMSFQTLAYNSGSKQYSETFTRVFNNNSSASISVNEVGLTYSSANGVMLFTRDVLVSPVVVPVGAQLTISIDLVSASFSSMESLAVSLPAIGASVGGGINLGPFLGWASSPNLTAGSAAHPKFALILSPKTGGDSTPVQWRTTNTALTYTSDSWYGASNTSPWSALGGSNVPAINVALTQNAASLGGYNDWYLPSGTEITRIFDVLASIPTGEQPENAQYWYSNSFTSGNVSGAAYNPTTAAGTNPSMTGTARVRLVRRHKLA